MRALHRHRHRLLPTALGIAALLAMQPARATPFVLDTSGTISTGTDTSGLFGASGASLAGDAFRLTLTLDDPGNYAYSSASEDTTSGPITGSVSVTIGGQTFVSGIANSYGALLSETAFELTGLNAGDDGAANPQSASASIIADVGPGISAPDLQTYFRYLLTPADYGDVSFSTSGPAGTASFDAVPADVSLSVPEPAAATAFMVGLVSLLVSRRRRWRLAAVPAAALLACASPSHAATNPCSPLTYGAVNDGATDNTGAIQQAITACAASGGGIVALSGGGTYITGPITLASHVLLQVNGGTTLKAIADPSRFVAAFIGHPFQANEALISASNAVDTGIIGPGTIDGSGQPYWDAAEAYATLYPNNATPANPVVYYPAPYADVPRSNGMPRPWLIEFFGSSHLTISQIHLQNSPMWNLGLRYCSDVTVLGYTVTNPSTSPNTDGIDVVASDHVTVANFTSDTGDDNVAIKSGLPGNYYGAPPLLARTATTNLTVVNGTLRNGHGISVGSETFNGIQHVRISNISYTGTQNGFRIKTGRDRGNDISDIVVQGLTMTAVQTPISLSAYYPSIPAAGADPGQPVTPTTPMVHDVSISRVTATGAKSGGLIIGLPEAHLQNINLSNVSIATLASGKGMELRNMAGTLTAVSVTPGKGAPFIVDEGVAVSGEPVQ